jgi:DNA-binding MarR family transcriptional regulator
VGKTDSAEEMAFPPPDLRDAYLRRFQAASVERLETTFALKAATQQMSNVMSEWLEETTGSPARFQALALLWGAGDRPVPHQEIISALQVKRATVSAMMFSLEQDGLVRSVGDQDDRRRLLATLTPKGKDVIESAMLTTDAAHKKALAGLSREELRLFQNLLMRIKNGYASVGPRNVVP